LASFTPVKRRRKDEEMADRLKEAKAEWLQNEN